MDLYIVRHAWAGRYGDPAWPEDRLRPLTKEGKQRFAQMAQKLVAAGMLPELVITSPLVRCRETAEVLAEAIGPKPKVTAHQALEPNSDLPALLDWMARSACGYDQVAWVGHAPDVGEMTAALIGDGYSRIRFAKGAVAAIRFDGLPRRGSGQLRWLATAKLLDC